MKMFDKALKKLIAVAALFVAAVSAYAQDGANVGYTPYSIFGIGDLSQQGSAYNRGMGGVGIATRNKRYLNYMNPASVTARDTISVMADMSLASGNKVMSQGSIKTASNTFNVNDIALSFPIYKSPSVFSSAIMVGIAPFSSVGYGYKSALEDESIIADAGNANFYALGSGEMYKFFTSAGVSFWNRLALGFEGIYYFGSISKSSSFGFTNQAYSSIAAGQDLVLRGVSGKIGIQYEQPVGSKLTVGLGATYSLDSRITGFVEDYRLSSGVSQVDTLSFRRDTLANNAEGIYIPGEIGLGISFNYADTWRAEFNYTRSDWTGAGMTNTPGFEVKGYSTFSTGVAESYKLGFEITPNRNDVRYYLRRCTYRAGLYYDTSYYLLDGNMVKNYGMTLGASLPVFRNFNSVNFAMDFGQRASLMGNMVRERYVNFTIGLNFHDYWFQKHQYN